MSRRLALIEAPPPSATIQETETITADHWSFLRYPDYNLADVLARTQILVSLRRLSKREDLVDYGVELDFLVIEELVQSLEICPRITQYTPKLVRTHLIRRYEITYWTLQALIMMEIRILAE
jgi:hypothetical protein